MKVLMYIVCILVYSSITTAINMNGVLLGAIPTMLLFVLCMSPAWAYGKHYDQKKYKEAYPNFSLVHIKHNVRKIQDYVQNECNFTNNVELFDVNEIFDKVIKSLLQQTEEENLKNLIKKSLSPMAYAKSTVTVCASEFYSKKQKEFKHDKGKIGEIEKIYNDFQKMLSEMPIEENQGSALPELNQLHQEENKEERCSDIKITKRKTSAVKIIIPLLLVIVGIFEIAFAIYYFVLPQFQQTIEDPKKFELSSNMPYSDPYGLTNINNIMGKDIRDVLSIYDGYTTDDYTIESNEHITLYAFHDTVPMGGYSGIEDVKLFIFTKNFIVSGVEYQGRYTDTDMFARVHFKDYIDECKDEIIDIRDVDPVYVFIDENGVDYEMTKDNWSNTPNDKGKNLIYFFSDIGAYIEVQNFYEEKKETFAIGHLLNE